MNWILHDCCYFAKENLLTYDTKIGEKKLNDNITSEWFCSVTRINILINGTEKWRSSAHTSLYVPFYGNRQRFRKSPRRVTTTSRRSLRGIEAKPRHNLELN